MNDVFQEDADTDDDLEFSQYSVHNQEMEGSSVFLFTDDSAIATPSPASPDQSSNVVLGIDTTDLLTSASEQPCDHECSREHCDDLEEPLSDSSADDIDEDEATAFNEDKGSSDLNNNAPWNNLTRFLTEWAARRRCSDASMTSLMSGLRDLHSNGSFPSHSRQS